jgi:hypothetical protein
MTELCSFVTCSWLTLSNSTISFTFHGIEHTENLHCDHMELVCFVLVSIETANFALQNIKILVFITEVENVYRAVRADCLYEADCV